MSSELATRQPAVQVNPFAKGQAEHLSAGTVAIESERAIAEAQGKLVIAKRFPRNQAVAYANIIDACRRPGLAEEATYSFPRGGEVVSGPAIRLAEMLAANWGNVDYGIRELSRKDGVSEMEAYCWDLETNTLSSQKFTVRHLRDTRGGQKMLTDERDIYELTANMGARRLRARILAILPADLVQAAVDQCKKTLASGGDAPLADRIRNMLVAFKTLGVPSALIEKRVGHSLDTLTGEELADLRQIHNSLRDGMSSLGDWFGDNAGGSTVEQELDAVPEQEKKQERAPAPERKARGARAAAQAQQASAEPPVTPKQEEPKAPEPSSTQAGAAEVEGGAGKVPAAPAPAPEPEKPKEPTTPTTVKTDAPAAGRAFLQPGETIKVECTIKEVKGINAKVKDVDTPSVVAALDGGYIGKAYHFGAAKLDNGAIVPADIWKAGTRVSVQLTGNKNPKTNTTYVSVDSVAPAVVKADEAEQF